MGVRSTKPALYSSRISSPETVTAMVPTADLSWILNCSKTRQWNRYLSATRWMAIPIFPSARCDSV